MYSTNTILIIRSRSNHVVSIYFHLIRRMFGIYQSKDMAKYIPSSLSDPILRITKLIHLTIGNKTTLPRLKNKIHPTLNKLTHRQEIARISLQSFHDTDLHKCFCSIGSLTLERLRPGLGCSVVCACILEEDGSVLDSCCVRRMGIDRAELETPEFAVAPLDVDF